MDPDESSIPQEFSVLASVSVPCEVARFSLLEMLREVLYVADFAKPVPERPYDWSRWRREATERIKKVLSLYEENYRLRCEEHTALLNGTAPEDNSSSLRMLYDALMSCAVIMDEGFQALG